MQIARAHIIYLHTAHARNVCVAAMLFVRSLIFWNKENSVMLVLCLLYSP